MSEKHLTITVHKQAGFSAPQLEKYVKAVQLTEMILNSEKFYTELLKLKLTNTKGFTNQQIYEKIMGGAEDLEPIEDNEVDVFISMYYKNNKVVGYTMPSTRETWVNSKFFDSYDPADIGCNLVHEWMHKLGFGHASASEHTSVPYAVGYMVERLIREWIAQPIPKPPVPVEVPTPAPVEVPKKKYCRRHGFLWLKKTCWFE